MYLCVVCRAVNHLLLLCQQAAIPEPQRVGWRTVELAHTAWLPLVSEPDSQPEGGGGVWHSCIQRAIMGYSLGEDSSVPIKGVAEALKQVLDE